MKDLLLRALDTAKLRGATYAEARLVSTQNESVTVRNNAVHAVANRTSVGIGVRVIANGGWGFASTSRLTTAHVDNAAGTAVRIAKASSSVLSEPVNNGEPTAIVARYITPIAKDPFTISLQDKIELLMKASAEIKRVDSKIAVALAKTEILKTDKIFASTEGSYIEQTLYETGCVIESTALGDDEMQNRSYPNSVGLHQGTEGWEFVERQDLIGHGAQTGEESVALLTAKPCPTGNMTIILDGSQTALQVHESCGHAIELDRVLGTEAAFAGTSFLTTDKLGHYRFGSEHVNMTIDATIPGGLGTFGFDDEGIPAQRQTVIKDGILVGYLTSRETATRLGLESNGTARASNWDRIPLIRMTNVNLEPGAWKLDALIADTDEGLYMETNRSWSIDDRRLNFQFGTETAREIKNGKLGDLVKNATYTGITPKFWGSCDAICGKDEWLVWGTPNCGKGQPEQVGHVGHGAAPARFRNVQVGLIR